MKGAWWMSFYAAAFVTVPWMAPTLDWLGLPPHWAIFAFLVAWPFFWWKMARAEDPDAPPKPKKAKRADVRPKLRQFVLNFDKEREGD